jgi:glycosyltransferase involved in cell wall biosynthesis
MKILYVITRSDWGGAQAHLFDVIEGMNNSNINCEVVVGEKGEFFERIESLGVKVYHLESLIHPINFSKDLTAIKELRGLIKQIQPDIVHCHSSKAGIIGRIAAWKEGIPSVFTAHGWAFTDGVSIKRKIIGIVIETLVAKITKKIICVSHYDRNLALKYKVSSAGKLIVIHNGVKDTDIQKVSKVKNDFIMTMVARFAHPKDQFSLIYALREIDNVTVNFVGDGPQLQKAVDYAIEIGVSNKCNFLGMRKDVDHILSESDCFILLSKYEGLPLSIIEAMRFGLPIIASDVGGVKELIVDGYNGFLISDNGEIASKIKYLIDNPTNEFGQNSRLLYEKNFNSKAMLEKIQGIYKDIIKLLE